MIAAQMLPTIGPIAPPAGIWGCAVAVFQCAAVVTSFSQEVQSPTEYSKFASEKMENPISSRNGMFRIYVPAVIAGAALTVHQATTAGNMSIAVPMLLIHFLKRTLEVAFVHKYSGQMPAASGNMIGTYYALIVLLIASTAVPQDEIASQTLEYAGLVLFAIGQLGNAYHHYLLSTLRSSQTTESKTKRYVPPHGGLFSLVATPHYLFELIGWLGIACVAQQMNAFLVFAAMTSYLSGRAYNTNQLYMTRFTKEE